ncbi:MAG: hypothetical protein AAF618_13240 [Pseudomonadota bacterium]
MVDLVKKATPAVAGISAGVFIGLVAMVLGSVMFTGQGFGTESEPPEQIYFF